MCFFFSSRRRHTRLTCDWSSDVCSSDLMPTREPRCWPRIAALAQGAAILGQHLGSRVGIEDVSLESDITNETSLVLGRYQIGRAACRERVLSSVGAVC